MPSDQAGQLIGGPPGDTRIHADTSASVSREVSRARPAPARWTVRSAQPRWRPAAGLAALALALLGCAPAGRSQPAQAPVQGSCRIQASGYDVTITVTGPAPATAECGTLIRDLSAGGYYWSYQVRVPQEGGWGTVCSLANGSWTMLVQDDGGQFVGQQVCSGAMSAGWSAS
jgi:hypothetical protein